MGGRCGCLNVKASSSSNNQQYQSSSSNNQQHQSSSSNNQQHQSSSSNNQQRQLNLEQHAGSAQSFGYEELAIATKNFGQELGQGGFGKVYKGRLSTGKVVAVKQLDKKGSQGDKEFVAEVVLLSGLRHINLVSLIGFCVDRNERMLVYEYVPRGSLEDHLHGRSLQHTPLNWNDRMKIAAGVAAGLEYLHSANPPVIHRDVKPSNVLLGNDNHAMLSDFGLAKHGPDGDGTRVFTRVMGTDGFCDPEYVITGRLTVKSDVYSFGVLLLELLTGRRALDDTRAPEERNLVQWAKPLFKNRQNFPRIFDPLLKTYPERRAHQALAVAAYCLYEKSSKRPDMSDVASFFSVLASQHHDPNATSSQSMLPGPSRNSPNSGPKDAAMQGSPVAESIYYSVEFDSTSEFTRPGASINMGRNSQYSLGDEWDGTSKSDGTAVTESIYYSLKLESTSETRRPGESTNIHRTSQDTVGGESDDNSTSPSDNSPNSGPIYHSPLVAFGSTDE